MNAIYSSVLFLLLIAQGYAQVELVPPDHSIYNFLQRMQTMKIIPKYNPANIPISRELIASFLKTINDSSGRVTYIDKKLLKDYQIEFEYEIKHTLKNSSSLISDFKNIFSDNKQKYLYSYVDSNASLFLDGIGNISQRGSSGDSIGKNSILLGELGLRVRGTMFNSLGYYLRASNGQKLTGGFNDVRFARFTDPKLFAQNKFTSEQRNFDTFDGYLRFRAAKNWLGLTIGRNPVYQGFGFIDKLFLSNNTVPFDFFRLDLEYKSISYSFLYGSLRGDSIDKKSDPKNIVTHRIYIQFSGVFKMGFFESVIISNSPFNFSFLNPLRFFVPSEINKVNGRNENNSIIGLDMELIPVSKLALQASLLIDDIRLGTLFKKHSKGNKIALQLGILWVDAFLLSNLELRAEYTRLNPFVYLSTSGNTSYTHLGLPLGHHLEHNSDEVAFLLNYNITSRLNLNLLYQYQRSANGLLRDSPGNAKVNLNVNADNAENHSYSQPEFLTGNRINRHIFKANLSWQFIRQFFLDLSYIYRNINNIYQDKKFTDRYYLATFRVDY